MPSSLNSLRRLEDFVGQSTGVRTRGLSSVQTDSLCQGLLMTEQQALMPALNIEPATPGFSKPVKALPEEYDLYELPRTPSTSSGFPSAPSWSAFSTPETQSNEVYPLAAFSSKASPVKNVLNTLSTTSSPILRAVSPLCRKPSPARKKPEPEEGFVKRPLNSFMLYRKDHQHRFATNNHQSISRAIGDMWRKETAETKNYYDKMAKAERDRHHLEHPGYKFQPKKKKDNKAQIAMTKMPRKKRSTEIKEEARAEGCSSSADISSDALTVPGPFDMLRQASHHSFQGTPLSFASSCDSFPFFVDGSGSPTLPPEYAHYAGHFDYASRAREQGNVQVPSQPLGHFRDPQDWHRRNSQTPVRAASYSSAPAHLDGWQGYEAHHGGTNNHTAQFQRDDAPGLLPPTFAEMDDRECQRRSEIDSWNANINNQSNQASSSYDAQYWQQQQPQFLSTTEEQDIQALDYAYALSTGFAPGIAHGSWELERNSF